MTGRWLEPAISRMIMLKLKWPPMYGYRRTGRRRRLFGWRADSMPAPGPIFDVKPCIQIAERASSPMSAIPLISSIFRHDDIGLRGDTGL